MRPDPTELLRRHIEYSAKRDKWAQRAIDLLAKGKRDARDGCRREGGVLGAQGEGSGAVTGK
jgi:hypothetical protein